MGSKLQRTMLFFLPIIAVKVTSPFDLAKYGTTFQEPPNHSGRSLYDVTLTWNLHSTIPSAQNLTAGVKMVQAVYQAEHPKTEVLPADAEWRRQVKLLYMELKTLPEIANNEAFWELFRNTLMHNSPDAKAGASTP